MLNLFNIFWYEYGMFLMLFMITIFTAVIAFYLLFKKGFAYEQEDEEKER